MAVSNAKPDRASWIQGPAATCTNMPPASAHPARLVLLGAPGVGKGTQAELLCAHFGACQLSTGDIFRAVKTLPAGQRSPAMSAALEYMQRGDLVPDTTVLEVVRERLACLMCGGGFLLDGFPRTVAQAEALETMLKDKNVALDAVLNYDLPIDEIVSRISGRRTCSKCKAIFHVTGRPPKVEGVCDVCGGKLIQREDDRPEAVRNRMDVYQKSTAPLINYYSQRNLLVTISATGTPEEICQRTLAALAKGK